MNYLILIIGLGIIACVSYFAANYYKQNLTILQETSKTPLQVAFEELARAILTIAVAAFGWDVLSEGSDIIETASDIIPYATELCIALIAAWAKIKFKYA